MKLFSDAKQAGDNKERNQQQKNMAQQVVIISPRREVLSEIASQLLMNNMKNIVEHEADFFSLTDDNVTRHAMAVIVDLVDTSDITQICEAAILFISAESRKVFVGNSDSIVFSQKLMRSGINYLHVESQLAQLAAHINETDIALTPRTTTMKISILGCKGGAGTSMVAHQLFQATGALSSIPALLVQGASGSNDLDLLMATALPKDGSIYKIATNQAARIETSDGAWVYDDPYFNQYNIVFFDHGIHTESSERLEMVIAQSHTIILVITRELAALRTAKHILDEYNRISLTRPTWKTRILVCLNENHPAESGELTNEDINDYLGRKIDSINPYDIDNKKLTDNSPLYRFTAFLLGKTISPHARKGVLSIFAPLRSYILSR